MAPWFDKLFPQAHVAPDNPVYVDEVRQIKGMRTPKVLLGYSLLLVYVVGLLVVSWYVVLDSNHSFLGTQLLLGSLGLLAIGFALVSDINCTRLAVRSLKDQPADVDKHDLIAARLALTEIRAWWLMGIEAAFRVTFFLVLSICFLNLSYWNIGQEISGLGDPFPRILELSSQLANAPGAWGILLAMLILLAGQMLEPLWRLHALAALGLKQSAQNENASLATAAQNIVIVWGIALLVYVVPGLFLAFMLRNATLNSVAFGLVAFSLVVAVANWGLYDWLESTALRQLETTETVVENASMLSTAEQDK